MEEKLPAPCEACHGSGVRHGVACGECQGKGYRLFVNGRQTPVKQQSPEWQRPRPNKKCLASPTECFAPFRRDCNVVATRCHSRRSGSAVILAMLPQRCAAPHHRSSACPRSPAGLLLVTHRRAPVRCRADDEARRPLLERPGWREAAGGGNVTAIRPLPILRRKPVHPSLRPDRVVL